MSAGWHGFTANPATMRTKYALTLEVDGSLMPEGFFEQLSAGEPVILSLNEIAFQPMVCNVTLNGHEVEIEARMVGFVNDRPSRS